MSVWSMHPQKTFAPCTAYLPWSTEASSVWRRAFEQGAIASHATRKAPDPTLLTALVISTPQIAIPNSIRVLYIFGIDSRMIDLMAGLLSERALNITTDRILSNGLQSSVYAQAIADGRSLLVLLCERRISFAGDSPLL